MLGDKITCDGVDDMKKENKRTTFFCRSKMNKKLKR